jgi:hypothetical protein
MKGRIRRSSLMVAALTLAAGCDPREPPPRGDSRDFAREVDELHARNQEFHERSQQLDRRLAVLAPQVDELLRRLAPVSAEWARDASVELEARFAEALEKLSQLRAVTGFDLDAMTTAAEEAVDELASTYEKVRARIEERSDAHSSAAPS